MEKPTSQKIKEIKIDLIMAKPDVWVQTDDEVVGPFSTNEEAQEYIYDRDDHGYDTRTWTIIG